MMEDETALVKIGNYVMKEENVATKKENSSLKANEQS